MRPFFAALAGAGFFKGFAKACEQFRSQSFVASGEQLFLRARQFLDARFQAESLFVAIQFKFSQNALRRERLGELCAPAGFMLFKTSFDIDSIPRINAVSRTTEHIDEMRHF